MKFSISFKDNIMSDMVIVPELHENVDTLRSDANRLTIANPVNIINRMTSSGEIDDLTQEEGDDLFHRICFLDDVIFMNRPRASIFLVIDRLINYVMGTDDPDDDTKTNKEYSIQSFLDTFKIFGPDRREVFNRVSRGSFISLYMGKDRNAFNPCVICEHYAFKIPLHSMTQYIVRDDVVYILTYYDPFISYTTNLIDGEAKPYPGEIMDQAIVQANTNIALDGGFKMLEDKRVLLFTFLESVGGGDEHFRCEGEFRPVRMINDPFNWLIHLERINGKP